MDGLNNIRIAPRPWRKLPDRTVLQRTVLQKKLPRRIELLVSVAAGLCLGAGSAASASPASFTNNYLPKSTAELIADINDQDRLGHLALSLRLAQGSNGAPHNLSLIHI